MSSSDTISKANQGLFAESQEQSTAIEEMVIRINDITQRINDNAVKTGEVDTLTSQVKQDATRGVKEMQQMVEAMQGINSTSTEISQIIQVIENIAKQTNILALNAAVEAARAGQAGKGFEVVAEEVRVLANRSSEAAKNTGELIENALGKIKLGSILVEATAQALNKIEQGVITVSVLNEEIAQVSEKQAKEINHVQKITEQVATITSHNLDKAQQSVEESNELLEHAQNLQSAMEGITFK
jgi:methyl-accepting chemotaxis protein